MATIIPVVYLGDPKKLDNTPPPVIECTEGEDAVEKLQAAIEAAKPAPSAFDLAEAAKVCGVTLEAVVETPSLCVNWSREQWEKSLRGVDAEALVQRIVPLLDDESIQIDNRNQFARILTNLGDRRGFDWNLRRFDNADSTDFSGASGDLLQLNLAGFQHREWLAGLELWPLIEPRLGSGHNYEGIGKELCPGEMQHWYRVRSAYCA